jgi:hypothetical protein
MKEIILFCALLGCGQSQSQSRNLPKIVVPRVVATAIQNDPRGALTIAIEFLPLVDKFESLWGYKVKTPIWFSTKLEENVLALCHTFSRSDGLELTEIIVQQTNYKQDSIQAEITIFHELGHCELKREHDTSLARSEDGQFVAYSVMYPTILDEDDYQKYIDHYMLELFKRGSLLTKFDPEE